MPDPFDPYREALVMETQTVWPDDLDDIPPIEKERIATRLHASPQEASDLTYVRTHTGFCRQIVVTPADLARING